MRGTHSYHKQTMIIMVLTIINEMILFEKRLTKVESRWTHLCGRFTGLIPICSIYTAEVSLKNKTNTIINNNNNNNYNNNNNNHDYKVINIACYQ